VTLPCGSRERQGQTPPTLSALGIWKRFGAFTALRGVDVTVRPGEVMALAGPNGAGKTTLFHILTGHLLPDAGSVRMDGADVTGLPPWKMARRGVGRLFQEVGAFGDLTVRENVEAALSVGGDCRDEALHWLECVGLADKADVRAGTLSLTDRRFLALARLMALKARLLLLDEPMAGLPPAGAERIVAFVRRMVAERGVSVALVEHDPEKVRMLADNVCFLHEGEVVVRGSPETVFADNLVRRLYAASDVRGKGTLRYVQEDMSVVGGRTNPAVAALRRERNVFPSLSVADNLRLATWHLPRALAAVRRKTVRQIFPFLFDRLGQRAGVLSGGQRQALAIAMVMCRDTGTYFFDEPSAGLAPSTASAMLAAIDAFAAAEPDRNVYVRESRMPRERKEES